MPSGPFPCETTLPFDSSDRLSCPLKVVGLEEQNKTCYCYRVSHIPNKTTKLPRKMQKTWLNCKGNISSMKEEVENF